jgi:hypothetical protein
VPSSRQQFQLGGPSGDPRGRQGGAGRCDTVSGCTAGSVIDRTARTAGLHRPVRPPRAGSLGHGAVSVVRGFFVVITVSFCCPILPIAAASATGPAGADNEVINIMPTNRMKFLTFASPRFSVNRTTLRSFPANSEFRLAHLGPVSSVGTTQRTCRGSSTRPPSICCAAA